MPNLGRKLVYPTSAMMFGARPVDVPGRGSMVCVSAGIPFCLSNGKLLKPANWYETLAAHCGMTVAPDSMSPLPVSEIVVLGSVPAVDPKERGRRASLRCGTTELSVILHADPHAEQAPMTLDASTALWHEQDNPIGRGGQGGQDAPPLITLDSDESKPVWLGVTPFDHQMRVRLAGTPDAQSGIGWPSDADPKILCEAHPLLWGEGIYPGDPIILEGLSDTPIHGEVPRYRITMVTGNKDGTWLLAEDARIHSLMLLPQADIGAMIWRTALPTGDDILGESILVALGALEDSATEPKPLEHWTAIVGEHWFEPDKAMDERPLLPESIAEGMPSPLAEADEIDPIKNRHEAAEDWVKSETGVPDNPFKENIPESQQGIMKSMDAMVSGEEPADGDRLSAIAKEVMEQSRDAHDDAGFTEEARPEERVPVPRYAVLDDEIDKRLAVPYSSEQEVALMNQMKIQPGMPEGDDDDIVKKIVGARLIGIEPVLNWSAFNDDEAKVFGERFVERLGGDDLERHIDVSGIIVAAAESRSKISHKKFDELLAEEGIWREIDWVDCEFGASSFVKGKFENCVFEKCTFEKTNLAMTTIDNCKFVNCVFKEMQIFEPTWRNSQYEHCTFEDISLIESAFQGNTYTGGSFKRIQFADGIMMECTFSSMSFNEFTLNAVHAPNNVFRQIEMFKVWGMSKGFPGCVFEEVNAYKCGFVGVFHFTESRFLRTRFTEVGMTLAQFKQVAMAPGCQFDRCDFTSATFEDAELNGVRFLGCPMISTEWENVQAAGAWFFESMLRGVDFGNTELARAVFADADLEEVVFQPERTIGADFRGTVVALKGG